MNIYALLHSENKKDIKIIVKFLIEKRVAGE